MANIRGGDPPQKNKLSSGGWALVVQAFPLDECSRNPSGAVHQLALLWEAVFCFSEFFLKTFSMCLPISRRVIYEHICPHYTECSAVFDQKWHDPCAPSSLFTQSGSERLFFVSLDEKALKGKCFADAEEVKQKWEKH